MSVTNTTKRVLDQLIQLSLDFQAQHEEIAEQALNEVDLYKARAEKFRSFKDPEESPSIISYSNSGGSLEVCPELLVSLARVFDALQAFHALNPSSTSPEKLIKPILRVLELNAGDDSFASLFQSPDEN